MRDREIKSLAQLNKLLEASEPLVKGATQAVAGEGPDDAEIVFVGEQPGDQEDLPGPALRRPGRQALRPGARRCRARPQASLRHQCGQALQVRAARQAPHPPEADRRRGQALPLVAREGARARPPEARGGARRHRRARHDGQEHPDHPRPRPARISRTATTATSRVHPSYLLAPARRGRQGPRLPAVRRGSRARARDGRRPSAREGGGVSGIGKHSLTPVSDLLTIPYDQDVPEQASR